MSERMIHKCMPVTLRSGHASFDIDPDRCRPHRATTGRRSRIGGAGPQLQPGEGHDQRQQVRAGDQGQGAWSAVPGHGAFWTAFATGEQGSTTTEDLRSNCKPGSKSQQKAAEKRNRSAYKCTSSDGKIRTTAWVLGG